MTDRINKSMEKKIISITATGERYTLSVDTFNEQGRFIKNDPGIDGQRTPVNDSALASLVDKYTTPRNSNYTIKVSSDGKTFKSVKDLLGRSDDTVKDRFLRWLRRIG